MSELPDKNKSVNVAMTTSDWLSYLKSEVNHEEVSFFKKLSIPLVRRIYPELIAQKIVSVQPMVSSSLDGLLEVEDNKQKKKKLWRSIEDDWEPSKNGD